MTLSKKILKKMEISLNIKKFFVDKFKKRKFDICKDGFDKLIAAFPKKKFDVWDVIEKLEDQKDSEGYSEWLFNNFKLTGKCRGWNKNKNLQYEDHYKKGLLHGKCRSWHENGKLQYECNFKNGRKL